MRGETPALRQMTLCRQHAYGWKMQTVPRTIRSLQDTTRKSRKKNQNTRSQPKNLTGRRIEIARKANRNVRMVQILPRLMRLRIAIYDSRYQRCSMNWMDWMMKSISWPQSHHQALPLHR